MSARHYEVVIVGAGPAGASAAIHLAAHHREVLLLDKATFPREKLCGEFLSTEVGALCERLGVLDAMHRAGARRVSRLALTAGVGGVFEDELPGPALSLSRQAFDHLLFRKAADAGADTSDGEVVRSIEGSLERGFVVETDRRRIHASVVVGAYGRRDVLDRRLGRESLSERTPFVGLKARYSGRPREEVVELHAFPGGYCGMLLDEAGATNVCWLSRVERLKEADGSPDRMVGDVLSRSRHLRARFDELTRTTEFLAVGQLSFRAKGVFAADVCMLGDAAGMIAPLCGDGMGMALRTSEIASPLIEGFLDGRLSANAFRSRYHDAWHDEFGLRMRLGRLFNAVLTRSSISRLAVHSARLAPSIARAAVAATRG